MDDRLTLTDVLIFWLDSGLSRTCRAPDFRGAIDRFLVVTLGARYGILGMILVAEERRTLGW